MRQDVPVWPKDTTEGRVLLAVVLPMLAVGGFSVKVEDGFLQPLWGWGLLGLSALITTVFMAFWKRGFFGHRKDPEARTGGAQGGHE